MLYCGCSVNVDPREKKLLLPIMVDTLNECCVFTSAGLTWGNLWRGSFDDLAHISHFLKLPVQVLSFSSVPSFISAVITILREFLALRLYVPADEHYSQCC